MTDRIKGFTVILGDDWRADDAEELRKVISLLKGVIQVIPIERTVEDILSEERAKHKLLQQMREILYPR